MFITTAQEQTVKRCKRRARRRQRRQGYISYYRAGAATPALL